ncbi:MAG: two-component system, OmpR family, alkaline phosphatase synthesis response regulator PhoP [Actinomycetota bacterium]|jgi:DNA-binding response OmpR family regulator
MSPRPGSLDDRLSSSSTAVLVVEDEPDIAGLLAAFFRASGLGLVHVNPRSVEEVLDAIVEHKPSCVLLDIMLGGISGLDVLGAIRDSHACSAVPVLIVSADPRPGTRKEAEGLGITAFVSKPFSVSALFDQVAALAAADAPDAVAHAPDRLGSHLARATQSGSPVSFALVHAGSNEAVVVRGLERCLPQGSVVGRCEDGEIPVIVPGTDAPTTAAALEACLPDCGPDVHAGVAEAPANAVTADELYMAADAALAEAVERGEAVVAAR